MRNGILLSGGTGSRLSPLTSVVNKHLIPLNGKFIIDYSLKTLMKLGCKDIAVVLGGNHFDQIVAYLGNGSRYGVNINYVYQEKAEGIAQAINLCKRFVYDDIDFSVVLGDNFFEHKQKWNNPDYKNNPRAQIMLANHPSLNRFGVASLDERGKLIKIEEKPKELDSNYNNYAVSGLYCFTQKFFDYFEKLTPSARGEYEVADIIDMYLKDDNLSYSYVSGLWSDAGTHDSIAYLNHYLYMKDRGITQV